MRATVEEIGEGILRQDFQPTPDAGDLQLLRLPDHLPGGGAVSAYCRLGPALAQEALEVAGDRVRRRQVLGIIRHSSSETSSIADSRRSTKALTSGSLATAALTWRS